MSSAKRVAARYAASKGDRDRSTGQYIHSRWSRKCKLCGHPVGVHSGEKSEGTRPCFHADTYHNDDACECPVFTSSPNFMTDEDYERYYAGKFDAKELRELRAEGTKSDAELKKMGEDIYKKYWEKREKKR
jgi:hypothetical protein